MKYKHKFKALALTLVCAAILSPNTSALGFEAVPTSMNGCDTSIDSRLIGSTTYVKLSEISSLLGAVTGCEPSIEAEEGKIYISARGRYFGGSENLELDGEIFVPIRSAAKAYGTEVEWREESRSVELLAKDSREIASGDEFYREDELYWLSRIIYAEAGSEPFEGKVLVGNVVMNRMRSDEFPDTIYSVIFDRKYGVQFTPTANGTIYTAPNEDSIIAAKLCLDSFSLSKDALYFLNPELAKSFWITKNRPFLFKVGGHEFYS